VNVSLFVCLLGLLCMIDDTHAGDCYNCTSDHGSNKGCEDPFSPDDVKDKCTVPSSVCFKYTEMHGDGQHVTRGCWPNVDHHHGCFPKPGGKTECYCHGELCNESSHLTQSFLFVTLLMLGTFLSALI